MIQRYDGVWLEMEEHVEGNYVTYEDHAAEVARLEDINAKLVEALEACLEKGKRWHTCDKIVQQARAAIELARPKKEQQ